MTARRIVIVDDHPLLATALARELEGWRAEVELLAPEVGAGALVQAIASCRPDCAVVDLALPFASGGSALIGPLAADRIRVVVLTGQSERQLWARSLRQGAETVLSKAEPLADIVEAILGVAGGEVVRPNQRAELLAELPPRPDPFAELSPREQEVLAGLMSGYGAAVLAERHYVSLATIRAQIRSILTKLGVGSQLEAVVLAYRSRWNPLEDK